MDAILSALGIESPSMPAPRAEIRPTEDAPIVAARETPRVEVVHWGLFGEERDGKKRAPLINVRAESLVTRPQFAKLFTLHRCVALSDGFYEWLPGETPRARKVPYLIHAPDGGPVALAGIYAAAKDGSARSFALLTTEANDVVAKIHDRMPVIVPRARLRDWLAPHAVTVDDLADVLRPAPHDALVAEPYAAPVTGERKSAEAIAQLALFRDD